ncbi:putative histidine kinase [Methanocella paludicola SANAE]|uniref:histidine kinase n=1 Tax=Methanocella paludicola (strain DSM 17711 / JCM 13418 / NBRC 101707 / SANAE) TaxID=304371 RepID=D1YYU3_METPS|nr:putative histidine kinase [Methanocella paludicola SANAE]
MYEKVSRENEERRRAEEALREIKERYKLVIAGARGAIWDWDVPNKRVFYSPQWKALRGLSDDEATDREEEWSSRIHPEDAPRVMAAVQAHFEGRTPVFAEEYRTLCKDGSWKWISDRGMAQRDAHGRVVRMAGSENDITERKHAEEALRDSEAHLNSIIRAVPTGIGVVVDRVITEANDNLCKMTGYTRDELLGKDARILYPSDEDYEYVGREKYDQINKYGTGTVETRWRRRDGSVIDIILSSTPMDPGNLRAGVTFTALDITERKRAEEAVRAADIRFRSLIQNSMDIIRILDREGRIIYESPSSDNILGYPPGHTLGRSPLEFIHPDDRERVKNALGEVYDGRNPGTPTEFRIRKADGSYLDVESTGKNMIGVPGVDGIVITTRPITERKRAEEALRVAKMQADLYVDLMCHDISNMNQVGMGFLEMALDMLDLDEAGQEMLLKPRSAFENSSKLIDNVRKLQKARSGEYPDREMDVGEVLGKVQDYYSRQHGPNVTINYPMNGGCVVRANELLYDLFSNLVGNAIKHSRAHPTIDINVGPASENGHDYYRVTIDDRGPGIPDELKDVIFERKLTGDIKSKGSGIGLLMAKALTDSYKGRIWVEDRIPGDSAKGSRFVVMLPAIE